MLGPILLTTHNLTYYQTLMREIREAIEARNLAVYAMEFAAAQALGDIEPLITT